MDRCDIHNHTFFSNIRLIDALSSPKGLIDNPDIRKLILESGAKNVSDVFIAHDEGKYQFSHQGYDQSGDPAEVKGKR